MLWRGFRKGVGRVLAEAVSRRLVTAGARVRSQVTPCEICGGQNYIRTGCLPFGFPLCHSTSAPYSSSSRDWCYQKDKPAKPGKLPKSNALPETTEHWMFFSHCVRVQNVNLVPIRPCSGRCCEHETALVTSYYGGAFDRFVHPSLRDALGTVCAQ
jgi:hypothetical protein